MPIPQPPGRILSYSVKWAGVVPEEERTRICELARGHEGHKQRFASSANLFHS